MDNLIINEYQLHGGSPYDRFSVVLRREPQLTGPDLWAVRCNTHYVLQRNGTWIRSLRPSMRLSGHIDDCRFATPQGALHIWNHSEAKRELLEEHIVSWQELAYC